MNKYSAPTYTLQVGEQFLVWYHRSNSYGIISPSLKSILDIYLASETQVDALNQIKKLYPELDASVIIEELETYLDRMSRGEPSTDTQIPKHEELSYTDLISKHYKIQGTIFDVQYSDSKVFALVHPQIAHLEIESPESTTLKIRILLIKDHLYIYQNDTLILGVPKEDYHHIQGKFIMLLLCATHNKTEDDWLGTIHGSSISDGHHAILFIGKSGSGKSTLCSLLAGNGYHLLADDVSPLAKANSHIYHNPGAISIKEGAFKTLAPYIPKLGSLPEVVLNPSKGVLKYLPSPRPEKTHYPCKAMILVSYEDGSKTCLEPLSIKEALETIIPDSWLHPGKDQAYTFLKWLSGISFFKLTYSQTQPMLVAIEELFDSLRNN